MYDFFHSLVELNFNIKITNTISTGGYVAFIPSYGINNHTVTMVTGELVLECIVLLCGCLQKT